MDKKILMQDLSAGVSSRSGLAKRESESFIRTFFGVIEQYLQEEKIVKIKGLGTFKVVEVSGRDSVNVNTGERIHIKGHSKVTFTPDAAIRDHVNRPFADFETIILNDGVDMAAMEYVDVPDDVTLRDDDDITLRSEDEMETTIHLDDPEDVDDTAVNAVDTTTSTPSMTPEEIVEVFAPVSEPQIALGGVSGSSVSAGLMDEGDLQPSENRDIIPTPSVVEVPESSSVSTEVLPDSAVEKNDVQGNTGQAEVSVAQHDVAQNAEVSTITIDKTLGLPADEPITDRLEDVGVSRIDKTLRLPDTPQEIGTTADVTLPDEPEKENVIDTSNPLSVEEEQLIDGSAVNTYNNVGEENDLTSSSSPVDDTSVVVDPVPAEPDDMGVPAPGLSPDNVVSDTNEPIVSDEIQSPVGPAVPIIPVDDKSDMTTYPNANTVVTPSDTYSGNKSESVAAATTPVRPRKNKDMVRPRYTVSHSHGRINDDESSRNATKEKGSFWKGLLKFLLLLLLLFVSYMAGSKHLFGGGCKSTPEMVNERTAGNKQVASTPSEPSATSPKVDDKQVTDNEMTIDNDDEEDDEYIVVPVDEELVDNSPQLPTSNAASNPSNQPVNSGEIVDNSSQTNTQTAPSKPTNNYPQVEGGAYEIIGVQCTYKLKRGETLSVLARRYYGDTKLNTYIVKLNNLSNPDLVEVGQVLKIPHLKKR